MLENAGKLELDCARERSIGGTTGGATNCSGLATTLTSVRTSTDGAVDGTVAALSSPTILFSANGASGSIVDPDNAKICSRIDFNRMSDPLISVDGVVT